MLRDLTGIQAEVARHVLHHFGDTAGYGAGGFTALLIELIARADVDNRARLFTAFPEYTAAVLLGQLIPDGIAQLRCIAQGADGG